VTLEDHRLTSIETSKLVSRYPRTIGPNARWGSHRSGSEDNVVIIGTDSGASGWGLVPARAWAEQALDAAGIDGLPIGTLSDLLEPDVEGVQRLIGRRVGDLFQPDVGVIDDAALGLDLALHDLAGRLLEMPVHQLLGGHGARSVDCYDGAIYFDDLYPPDESRGVEDVLQNCADDHALGYRDFKLKIGRGTRWMDPAAGQRRDIEVTRAVREAHPRARILVDANNGYSCAGFLTYMQQVGDCDVFWVEEPFEEAREDLTALRSHLDRAGLNTLIADGEGSESEDGWLLELASSGLIDVIQFDVVQYGLTAWRRVMPKLAQLGVRASPHTWGCPISTLYAAQLAAGLGNVIMVEGVPGSSDGVDTSGYVLADGAIGVPDDPGFGIPLVGARGS
jgi:D-galactarolactone cycloisomerase